MAITTLHPPTAQRANHFHAIDGETECIEVASVTDMDGQTWRRVPALWSTRPCSARQRYADFSGQEWEAICLRPALFARPGLDDGLCAEHFRESLYFGNGSDADSVLAVAR